MARCALTCTVLTAAALLLLAPGALAFDICGAGDVFKHVECGYYQNARDLETKTPGGGTCANTIACGPGGSTLYEIKVEAQYGPSRDTGKTSYYARGTATPLRGDTQELRYCWKRQGADSDGCACLCEAIRYGLFRDRPDCVCRY